MVREGGFGGGDRVGSWYGVGRGMGKIGEYEMIVGGGEGMDGDRGEVGGEVGEKLGLGEVS